MKQGFVKIILLVIIVLAGTAIFYFIYLKLSEKPNFTFPEMPAEEQRALPSQLLSNDEFQSWLGFWQKHISDLRAESFSKDREESIGGLTTKAVDAAEHFQKLNGAKEIKTSVFSFNGQSFFDYIGFGPLVGGEPDSEVTVYYFKDGKVKSGRLLFCGTPCVFDNGFWLDDDEFAITQVSEYYPKNGEGRCAVDQKCAHYLSIYLYDFTSGKLTVYISPEIDKNLLEIIFSEIKF